MTHNFFSSSNLSGGTNQIMIQNKIRSLINIFHLVMIPAKFIKIKIMINNRRIKIKILIKLINL